MKTTFASILLLLCFVTSRAQTPDGLGNYWVFFTDKACLQSPAADFDAKALERRAKMGIAFPTIEDFPVNSDYVAAVVQIVHAPRQLLRWFNVITVTATPSQIAAVAALPFVRAIESMAPAEASLAEADDMEDGTADAGDSLKLHTLFNLQRDLIRMQSLEDAGLSGKGLRIAVLDAGFSGADTHIAFEHLRKNGQIKATKDFVTGDADVYDHSNHGTAVLSCIGGMYEGKRMGAAVDAEFLLARTEFNHREKIAEEDFWLAAMEWADQQGADIISSSLGYSKPRYTYADMTGSKTIVSRAAALAVRKGMLVVVSAGNEGSGKFHYIGAPADADSVLTVGGCYPNLAYRMPFSSLGPNTRGVLKPEISAPGAVLAANKKGDYRQISGTSFSCPLVAGIAACIMQKWPNESNLQTKQRLMAAGNTYPYFDYALGYGVLDAQKALAGGAAANESPTFIVRASNDTTWVVLKPMALASDSARYRSVKPFYVHYVKEDGTLSGYRTYLLRQKNLSFGIPPSEKKEGRMEMWFEGYMWKEQ